MRVTSGLRDQWLGVSNQGSAIDNSQFTIRFISLILLNAFTLLACTTPPQPPALNQADLLNLWSQDKHGVWDLAWSDAPFSGSIIFEAWQAGAKQRYEILEATVPNFIGLVYISDGEQAQHYNRLLSSPNAVQPVQHLPFSPISHAFTLITDLLQQTPSTIEQPRQAQPHDPIPVYICHYLQGQVLTLWVDEANGQIVKLHYQTDDQTFMLTARLVERLVDPHPRLFILNDRPK